MKKIYFLWNGKPQYCLDQINFIKKKNKKFDIRLISNSDFLLKKNISWKELGYNIPNILFVSGWSYVEFFPLIKEVRSIGGRVVCLVDNSQKFNLRQFFGKFYFIFFLKKKYDFFWVPGQSSYNLLKSYNVKKEKIFKGLYAVNNKIFHNKKKLIDRKNEFIYVGQLIDRKNIQLLIKAFLIFLKRIDGKSRLHIVTNTSNFSAPKNNKIIIKNKLNSLKISNYLNKIKFFVLLSKEDHWPLAALEAASCGNFLITSSNVGSLGEVVVKNNSVITNNMTPNCISKLFLKIYNSSLNYYKIAKTNNKILEKYSLNNYNKIFVKIIESIN